MAESKCWCGGSTIAFDGKWHCNESEFHDPQATGRPAKVERLYVAGPMSNYPENNYPAFHDATDRLRDAGFLVVNPAEYGSGPEGASYQDLLRIDLQQMLTCHGVAMLDYWWESTGARNEIHVAGLLKMPCRTVEDWLMIAKENN